MKTRSEYEVLSRRNALKHHKIWIRQNKLYRPLQQPKDSMNLQEYFKQLSSEYGAESFQVVFDNPRHLSGSSILSKDDASHSKEISHTMASVEHICVCADTSRCRIKIYAFEEDLPQVMRHCRDEWWLWPLDIMKNTKKIRSSLTEVLGSKEAEWSASRIWDEISFKCAKPWCQLNHSRQKSCSAGGKILDDNNSLRTHNSSCIDTAVVWYLRGVQSILRSQSSNHRWPL